MNLATHLEVFLCPLPVFGVAIEVKVELWKGSVVRRRKRSNALNIHMEKGQGVRATLVLPWPTSSDLGHLADLTSNFSAVSYLS
jgi:hypothetical protein